MKSVQNNLKRIRDALNGTSAKGRVFHYKRPKDQKPNWIVWQEDGEADFMNADNRKQEQQIHGTIDCYTLAEYDPLLDEIQDALNKAGLTEWSLLSVQYEDETNLIHYEWEFYIA